MVRLLPSKQFSKAYNVEEKSGQLVFYFLTDKFCRSFEFENFLTFVFFMLNLACFVKVAFIGDYRLDCGPHSESPNIRN